jgi:hypothetical protein
MSGKENSELSKCNILEGSSRIMWPRNKAVIIKAVFKLFPYLLRQNIVRYVNATNPTSVDNSKQPPGTISGLRKGVIKTKRKSEKRKTAKKLFIFTADIE